MNILGISAFFHDSAAALVSDGRIVAAAQEERFTRVKHDADYPERAVEYCLKEAGISKEDIDLVVFYDKPFLKFERILSTYAQFAPKGFKSFIKAIPVWIRRKLWLHSFFTERFPNAEEILFTEHHESHAASAFFPSPFQSAAVLTIDGVGEYATTSLGVGDGNTLRLEKEINFPHSLGLLYSAFTYYTGFKVNSGEYKVMGLAPYGEPKYVSKIYENLIDVKPDGSFRLNMDYFNYCSGLTMTNSKFDELFGAPPRQPESDITQREMDLAASVQVVCEDVMIKLARHAKELTGQRNLCLAGGVALNCVGNGKIIKENIFESVWIQPAAGDAGGALGAALFTWYQYLGNQRQVPGGDDLQSGSYLGPDFESSEIEKTLNDKKLVYTRLSDEELAARAAEVISGENVLGWFQGRMEFGPRALGARSIIGDARSPKMQSTMNLKIKYRESFRPFAPSVLKERVSNYFDLDKDSPYMLVVAPVVKEKCKVPESSDGFEGLSRVNQVRSEIPAVTHVDYSARVQTVDGKWNKRYADLIREFEKQTSCSVIINTSFNVRGEPIVCTPDDAVRCFMRTEMDYLLVGNYLLKKTDQPKWEESEDWKEEFVLD